MPVQSGHKMSKDYISWLNVDAQMSVTVHLLSSPSLKPYETTSVTAVWHWILLSANILEYSFGLSASVCYQMTIWIFSAGDFIFEDIGDPLVCQGAEKGHVTEVFKGITASGDGKNWTRGNKSLPLKHYQAPRILTWLSVLWCFAAV